MDSQFAGLLVQLPLTITYTPGGDATFLLMTTDVEIYATHRMTGKDRSDFRGYFISNHLLAFDTVFADLEAAGFAIVQFRDLSHIGRTHLSNHFVRVFENVFAPRIVAVFPDHGRQICDEFVAAVSFTIRLYQGREADVRSDSGRQIIKQASVRVAFVDNSLAHQTWRGNEVSGLQVEYARARESLR